jgi:ParB-like chromosome segregation protein Spo0J
MAHVIKMVSLDDIRPHPENPKTHSIPLIQDSLRRFGFTAPLLVCERTGYLAAGHGRRAALLAERGEGHPPPSGH